MSKTDISKYLAKTMNYDKIKLFLSYSRLNSLLGTFILYNGMKSTPRIKYMNITTIAVNYDITLNSILREMKILIYVSHFYPTAIFEPEIHILET